MHPHQEIELIRMLLDRLERVSADSYWAHRASGVRGSLLEMMDCIERGQEVKDSNLRNFTNLAFSVLQRAAEKRIT